MTDLAPKRKVACVPGGYYTPRGERTNADDLNTTLADMYHDDAPQPSPSADVAASIAPRTSEGRQPMVRLLRELHLENFMLHADSRIPFATPIVLLTGANGSGKTQILDALLLALGSKSTRVKKEGLAELVGPHGDTARVTLTLYNPRRRSYARATRTQAEGHLGGDDEAGDGDEAAARLGDRALASGVAELDRLTDAELVNVRLELSRDHNAATYKLGPPGSERRVTQGMIERLFSQAGVSPRNSLAFTEEGTISNFSSDSPHKQFEAFLETTHLLELRELLEKLQTEVANAKSRLDPLEQQYHMQRSLLEHMRTDLENLRRREELEEKVRTLETELAWAHARQAATQAEEVHASRERMNERLAAAKARKSKAQAELEQVRVKMEELHATLDRLDALARDRARQQGQIESALEHNRNQTESMERGLAGHDEEIATLRKRIAEAGGDEVRARLAEAQTEYDMRKQAVQHLEHELEEAQRTVRSTLHASTLPGSTLTGRGLEYLTTCLRLRHLAAEHGLGNGEQDPPEKRRLFGPLLAEWRLREELDASLHAVADEALPLLLAEALTVFVARDEEAWQHTLTLIEETFDEPRPPLAVYLAPARPPAVTELTGLFPLTKLVNAPEPVLSYLQAAHPCALPEPGRTLPLHEARSLAQDLGARLYLPAQRLLVGPAGFALPDRAASEVATRLSTGVEPLKRAAEAHARIAEFEPKLAEAKRARDHAHEAMHQASLAEEEVGRLKKLLAEQEERRTQLTEALAATKERIAKYERDLAKLTEDEAQSTKRTQASEELDRKRTRRSELEVEVREQEGAIEQADLRVQQLESELKKAQEEAAQQKQAASALGSKPSEERSPTAIEAELNQTRGTLEGLKRITRTREEYEAQERQVEKLHADVQHARDHLDGLEEDLKLRLREWKAELGDRLDGARKVMRHLLREHFERVDLRAVEMAKKGRGGGEAATALELRCSRRGGPMLTLAGLSGGEKVLVVGALIFALHCLTDSPVHALDEFTQKLDVEFKAASFRMAVEAVAYAAQHAASVYAPQFVLLCPDTLGVDIDTDEVSHVVVIRADDEQSSDSPRHGRATVRK